MSGHRRWGVGVFAALLGTLIGCAQASTATHQLTGIEHERLAIEVNDPTLQAEHRAAAEELRAIERVRCAGEAPELAATMPFFAVDEVERVSWLMEGYSKRKKTLRGAIVYLKAGVDENGVRRRMACFKARLAVAGAAAPALEACPIAVSGARAAVRADAGRVRVVIRAEDPDAATQIWTRALRLSHHHPQDEAEGNVRG